MKISKAIGFFSDKDLASDRFPYFYLPAFSTFTTETEGKEILIVSDQENNSMALKKWRNKFLSLLQPVYPPLSKNAERLTEADEKKFLDELIPFLRKEKIVHRITQPENFAIFHAVPDHCIAAPFGTYFLDLAGNTEEALFTALHGKHRNVIRNAEKQNVVLKFGANVVDDFFSIYRETMQRSNMYCQQKNYFESFHKIMPNNILCGVAYHNEIPQGGLFMPFTNFGAFYLYGASAEKPSITGCMNYLHWDVIKMLKQKGVKRYDFVGARMSDVSGTKLAGIQQFKERFGARMDKGFLWKIDLDGTTSRIFDNLVAFKLRLKKQSPPRDIIDQERAKFYVTS